MTPDQLEARRKLFESLVPLSEHTEWDGHDFVSINPFFTDYARNYNARWQQFNLDSDHFEKVIAEKDAEIARLKEQISQLEFEANMERQ